MNRLGNSAKLVVLSGSLLICGMAAGGYADSDGGWVKGACKADVQKLCGDVKAGNGDIHNCMKQHEADLSQGCKDNMAQMKAKMQEKMAAINTACKADEDQYCKDVTPGEGREIACLKAHNDKISKTCKDTMKSMHPHRGGKMRGAQPG